MQAPHEKTGAKEGFKHRPETSYLRGFRGYDL